MAGKIALLKRRELIKRIAIAGTAPAVVAVIANTTGNDLEAGSGSASAGSGTAGTGTGSVSNVPSTPTSGSGSGASAPPDSGLGVTSTSGSGAPPSGSGLPPTSGEPLEAVTPEPSMFPVVLGLGAAIAIAARLRRREKPGVIPGSDSNS